MIDGEAGTRTLRRGFRRAERRRTVRALLLVLPLFAFLLVAFLAPIARMLERSIEDPEMGEAMPATAAALRAWPGGGQPPQDVAAAFIAELPKATEAKTLASVAQRLNHDVSGMRSLILATGRAVRTDPPTGDPLAALKVIDGRWAEAGTWAAMRRAAFPLTDFFLLSALDLDRDANGDIVRLPAAEGVFTAILIRTLVISLGVTLLCLILGFPVSYLLSTTPPRIAGLLMILVLLPFWTSLLVRTSAWVIILQNEGILNGLMLGLGLADRPIPMIFNRFGVYVAMTHVLLPFMVLPLYSVMQGIPPSSLRAAASLGAPPWKAFVRVYLPQAAPGIAAGCLLVFILALGYYITPALVGGADDQMISYFIAFYTSRSVNWGLAAALAALLLGATAILYAVYTRLAGSGGPKFG